MKAINITILAVLVLFLPISWVLFIFGLAGGTWHYFLIIGFGYLLAIAAAVLSFFWKSVRYVPSLGVLLIFVGLALEARFWTQHNKELCLELRANPTCIEDETGFDCSDFNGHRFSTGKAICKDVSTQI